MSNLALPAPTLTPPPILLAIRQLALYAREEGIPLMVIKHECQLADQQLANQKRRAELELVPHASR